MRPDHDDHDPQLELATEAGQTMAEYAIVLCVITIAILTAIIAIGDAAGGLVNRVAAFL